MKCVPPLVHVVHLLLPFIFSVAVRVSVGGVHVD